MISSIFLAWSRAVRFTVKHSMASYAPVSSKNIMVVDLCSSPLFFRVRRTTVPLLARVSSSKYLNTLSSICWPCSRPEMCPLAI